MAEPGIRAGAKPPQKLKMTLDRENVGRTLGNALKAIPTVAMALVKPRTSPALREKIMLGVVSVTDCRYCEWGHSRWATAHGVALDEINEILGQQIEALRARDPAEATAIMFAQHYAETLGHYEPQAVEDLGEHYTPAQVAEILAYLHMILCGSLTGNTLDAFLAGFSREPKPARVPGPGA